MCSLISLLLPAVFKAYDFFCAFYRSERGQLLATVISLSAFACPCFMSGFQGKDLAVEIGAATDEIGATVAESVAEGLEDVESAGLSATDAVAQPESSDRVAKQELTDMKEVSVPGDVLQFL